MGANGPEPSDPPQDFALPPAPPAKGPWVVSAAATNTAWSGPWGVNYTAAAGPILPPMPIPMYKHFNDADLEAIFAYLQSIPAIRNKVPSRWLPEGVRAPNLIQLRVSRFRAPPRI
jgi:hypothetical protein